MRKAHPVTKKAVNNSITNACAFQLTKIGTPEIIIIILSLSQKKKEQFGYIIGP